VGSYNWACAECASIVDSVIRDLCIACIMTPADDARYVVNATTEEAAAYALKLDSTEWVDNAAEIVCSCVNMAKASTWGVGGLEAWYISTCPDCTAMQKRRNITWSEIPSHSGDREDPRVPFIKVGNADLPDSYELSVCVDLQALVDKEKTYLISVLGSDECATRESVAVRVDGDGNITCGDIGPTSPECSIAVPNGTFSGYTLVHLDDPSERHGRQLRGVAWRALVS
ncbi:hypothetical protein FOA52_003314, partial [Chlamydomonas sp. UWO 241]